MPEHYLTDVHGRFISGYPFKVFRISVPGNRRFVGVLSDVDICLHSSSSICGQLQELARGLLQPGNRKKDTIVGRTKHAFPPGDSRTPEEENPTGS